jgi:predicted  nucleic acid-binding Zn-ribbon protein
MSRTKPPAIPDTHVLKRFMEEYVEMLREAEKAVKKVLALNPQKEEFWDQLSEHAAEISMVEIRSKTIVEEIDNLIDQLPED